MTAELLVLAPLRVEAIAVRSGLGATAVVLRTGMGPARARAAAERARAIPAGAVLVAGLCGAVSPDLRPGDVVVATEAAASDGAKLVCSRVDELAAALVATGARVVVGPIASCGEIVGRDVRRSLVGSAVAVDMESAWLAAAAGGRPLAVARVVVDTAARRLGDPRTLVAGVRALLTLLRLGPGFASWAVTCAAPTPETTSRVGWAAASALPDAMTRDLHPSQTAIGGSRR